LEAFFRTLKNNFFYKRRFDYLSSLSKAARFYIQEYNKRIPYDRFKFATPEDEPLILCQPCVSE